MVHARRLVVLLADGCSGLPPPVPAPAKGRSPEADVFRAAGGLPVLGRTLNAQNRATAGEPRGLRKPALSMVLIITTATIATHHALPLSSRFHSR